MLVQNEIPILQTCEAIVKAKEADLVTIFNPSPIPSKDHVDTLLPWQSIDWLIVNEDEATELAKAFGHDTDRKRDALEQLGQSLKNATGIVMTKGAAGAEMLLRMQEEGFIRLESPCGQAVHPIINTTGAGDTFAVSECCIPCLVHAKADNNLAGISDCTASQAWRQGTRRGEHAFDPSHRRGSSYSLL